MVLLRGKATNIHKKKFVISGNDAHISVPRQMIDENEKVIVKNIN